LSITGKLTIKDIIRRKQPYFNTEFWLFYINNETRSSTKPLKVKGSTLRSVEATRPTSTNATYFCRQLLLLSLVRLMTSHIR